MIPNKLLRSFYLFSVAQRLKKIPFAGLEQWKAVQNKLLGQMIRHAYESVPFYQSYMRQKGLKPSDFNSVSDLPKLPFVSKEDILKNPDNFQSARYRKNACLEIRTSGTTGMPASFWHDRKSLFLNAAYGVREWDVVKYFGKKNGFSRELFFRQPDATFRKVQRFYNQHLFRPNDLGSKRMVASTADSLSKNIDLLNRHKPDVLSSYGSYLGMLFQYARKKRIQIHAPKIAVYCADGLNEADQSLIEDTFQIPVRSVYRSAEALKIGFMCEQGKGIHLHPDICPLFLVDKKGEPVEPGRPGEVVISNLLNKATVLLNYRIGDLAVFDTHPCNCGRTFPLLKSLNGRKSEIINLPNGSGVDPNLLRSVFSKIRTIERYQVIQTAPLSFSIKVLPSAIADTKAIKQELKKELVRIITEQVEIDILIIKNFPMNDSGKFKAIVPFTMAQKKNLLGA